MKRSFFLWIKRGKCFWKKYILGGDLFLAHLFYFFAIFLFVFYFPPLFYSSVYLSYFPPFPFWTKWTQSRVNESVKAKRKLPPSCFVSRVFTGHQCPDPSRRLVFRSNKHKTDCSWWKTHFPTGQQKSWGKNVCVTSFWGFTFVTQTYKTLCHVICRVEFHDQDYITM